MSIVHICAHVYGGVCVFLSKRENLVCMNAKVRDKFEVAF